MTTITHASGIDMRVGDAREHTTTRGCWCKPTRDTEKRDVWIHHSVDQREKFETGERKPS